MLKVIEKLMDKGEGLSPEEEKLLKLLTRLVEDFEERYYHPRDATPLEVLQDLMESREIKQTHLWEVFGSKGIASEVLNGKRGISKTHARALAEYFHVPRICLFEWTQPRCTSGHSRHSLLNRNTQGEICRSAFSSGGGSHHEHADYIVARFGKILRPFRGLVHVSCFTVDRVDHEIGRGVWRR